MAQREKARETYLLWPAARRKAASDGELFWYITQGDVNNGMPSWQSLPEEQRWEIVNYLTSPWRFQAGLSADTISSEEAVSVGINAPPPQAAVYRLPF